MIENLVSRNLFWFIIFFGHERSFQFFLKNAGISSQVWMKKFSFHLKRIADLFYTRLTVYLCTDHSDWAKIDSHSKPVWRSSGERSVTVMVVGGPEVAPLHPVNKWKRWRHFCAQFVALFHNGWDTNCKEQLQKNQRLRSQRKLQIYYYNNISEMR